MHIQLINDVIYSGELFLDARRNENAMHEGINLTEIEEIAFKKDLLVSLKINDKNDEMIKTIKSILHRLI